jgi:acyl-homoserine lactone acylase PvdQ
MIKTLPFFCAVLLILSACAQHSPSKTTSQTIHNSVLKTSESGNDIDVGIRWTSYGIPHVKAHDWASLGYGYAYATATDGVCVIARDIVTVNGNLSKYFGDQQRANDLFHRAVVSDSLIAQNNLMLAMWLVIIAMWLITLMLCRLPVLMRNGLELLLSMTWRAWLLVSAFDMV